MYLDTDERQFFLIVPDPFSEYPGCHFGLVLPVQTHWDHAPEYLIGARIERDLREYSRWMRPKTYLFPGTENGWRADRPITTKYLWQICQEAAHTAGIKKHVNPHLIRHSFA